MPHRLAFACCLWIVATALNGCDRGKTKPPPDPTAQRVIPTETQAKLPHIDVRLADKIFKLEVAATPEQHRLGLMGRAQLGEDEGMIFVFDHDGTRQFWMKNCLIPLDIVYLDQKGIVVGARTLPPPKPNTPDDQVPSFPFHRPVVRYVIELNAGMANRLELHQGRQIDLPHATLQKYVQRADKPS